MVSCFWQEIRRKARDFSIRYFPDTAAPLPARAQNGQGPTYRAGNRGGHEQSGQYQHHSQYKCRAQAGQNAHGQELMLEEPAALFLQIGLVTGELIEPFVDLQPPPILSDQVSAAIHCCAEILLPAGF